MITMKRVIIESPYAGQVDRNLQYVRAALRDCLLRHESPFASHALYTQPGVLDDDLVDERALGIQAGFAWRSTGALTLFYCDLGWSRGMRQAELHCLENRFSYEVRRLGGYWELDL